MSPGILVSPADPTNLPSQSQSQSLVTDTLTSARQAFLQPTPELHAASLELAKYYLDPLAASVSEVQQSRLEQSRRQRKRKRNEREDYLTRDVLRLKQLHLEGFGIEQVWEQARRVIEAGQREAERSIRRTEAAAGKSVGPEQKVAAAQAEKRVHFEDESESEKEDEDMEGVKEWDSRLAEEEGDDDDDEGVDGLDAADGDEDIEDDSGDDFDDDEAPERFIKDAHGLNDGFFSIDDFNRQTEFLEEQDARGDPNDGAASDEEDIDWTADPSTLPVPQSSRTHGNDEMDSEVSDEDEEGPTFGNADLDAPWSDSEDEEDMELDTPMRDNPLANTNDIRYEDFFAPPPLPPSKKTKRRLPKTQPPPSTDPEALDEEMERTMSAARRDIFEDDSPEASSDENGQMLSSHERRQAALAAQIRKLEAEAVSQREWAMSGEARASDRPLNSLLEEDLEFERTGKPVPVVTAEVSSTLEELIKQRILDRQFNEVTKRIPGSSLLSGSHAKRGLVDIETRAPEQQSLSALYEAEHLQRTDPNYVAPRDAKLKAVHAEIERLWSDVSSKLDALSNWHYRPKPPDVEVAVVTDAPRVAMEEARPTAGAMQAEESGLAPQEVYKAGSAREKGDVVTRSGNVVAKEELSREVKQRHHRREMEREKKKNGNETVVGRKGGDKGADRKGGMKGKNAKVDEQQALTRDLKQAGVKVIGKSGEIVDVEGKKVRAKHTVKGAGSYKL